MGKHLFKNSVYKIDRDIDRIDYYLFESLNLQLVNGAFTWNNKNPLQFIDRNGLLLEGYNGKRFYNGTLPGSGNLFDFPLGCTEAIGVC